jgi:quercetin dioxygenase-like cupin family protein
MKLISTCLLLFLLSVAPIFGQAQFSFNELFPEDDYENISVKKLYGDSLATGFLIWVKDTVASHSHNWHSESIVVIDGSARMYMDDTIQDINAGDVLFIPKQTWHAVKVTSDEPLKVLSVQSPGFYGKDREFKDD